MNKLLSLLVVSLMLLSVMPLVVAEDADVDIGIGIEVGEENDCPEIYQDATQRSWYPNDQTIYTATEYGTCDTNIYGDETCAVEERGNYVFEGETLAFYVIVEDDDGDDDIESVVLNDLGACVEITPPSDGFPSPYTTWDEYAQAKFGISEWDADKMNLYKCKVIVGEQTGEIQIKVEVEDVDNSECYTEDIKEYIEFNPSFSVAVEGSINFGTVEPGSVATSTDPVKIRNTGDTVLDMYVASDDYFIDAGNEDAICGDEGNGIKYDQFSYYATKGSINSGSNDNSWPGLGEYTGICAAKADEYTPMPSHSGHIEDMCRVINHAEDGSFLIGGDFMSVLVRLDVPEPCEGNFNQGQFHFVGRVV